MSHTVEIRTEVRDRVAIAAACDRLKLEPPVDGMHQLFSSNRAQGTAVGLRGWRYPVVFDLNTGAASFDNYGGAWGKQDQLDAFVQRYAIEKARIEARKAGHTVSERAEADGSIVLTITT